MKKSKKVWSLLLVLSLVIGMAAGGVQSQAYSVPSNMKWWTKDRFGMFIHFGAYSYYGHGEWAMTDRGDFEAGIPTDGSCEVQSDRVRCQ